MHPVEPILKNLAYLEPPSNKIAQRYAPHNKASRMYYNTSPLSQKNNYYRSDYLTSGRSYSVVVI